MLVTTTGVTVKEDFLKVIPDANGFLPNVSSETIDPLWEPLVMSLATTCEQILGDVFHSIYIRGSIAANRGIPGFSDIDFFVVVTEEPSQDKTSPLSKQIQDLLNDSKLASKAEFKFLKLEKALSSVSFRLQIGVYGKFLLGEEDLTQRVSQLKIGRGAFHHANNISGIATKAINNLDNQKYVEWYARNVLRAGMEMIATKAGYTTRDLYGCFLALKEFSPIEETDLKTLLFVSIDSNENWQNIDASFVQRMTSHLTTLHEQAK